MSAIETCNQDGQQSRIKYSSPITRVSLTRIGCNAIDKQVNAVCITRTSAYASWLLRDFSDQCEDMLDDGPNFF